MINEASLKSTLVKIARAELYGYVIERHEDRFTHGIPDICITGNHKNTRWEAKHANPGFKVKGVQELTMSRLDLANHARFIVYYEKDGNRFTYIVHPKEIGHDRTTWKEWTYGFNHNWVVSKIREAHQ